MGSRDGVVGGRVPAYLSAGLATMSDKGGHFIAPFNMTRTPEAEAADLRRYM